MLEQAQPKSTRPSKRPVSRLTEAQLERKRANDRQAQRNIRQKTKAHIEALEQRVHDLEGLRNSAEIERMMERNRALEYEIAQLRAQLKIKSENTGMPMPLMDHKDMTNYWNQPSLFPWVNSCQDVTAGLGGMGAGADGLPMYGGVPMSVSTSYMDDSAESSDEVYTPYTTSGWHSTMPVESPQFQ